MSRTGFAGISQKNFKKLEGVVDVFLVVNPSSMYKSFIPINGTEPLNSALIDNTSMRYVVFGDRVKFVKKIPFVPCFTVDGCEFIFPFTKSFIFKSLNKKEKLDMVDTMGGDLEFTFFQIVSR